MEKIKKIYNYLEQIKNENSTNKKIDILKKAINDKEVSDILKKILHNTYDKRIKYYVDIKTLKKLFEEIKNIKYKENISHKNFEKAIKELEKISSKYPLKNRITGFDAHKLIQDVVSEFPGVGRELLFKILNKDLKIGMNIKNINKALGKEGIYQTPYNGAETLKINKLDKNLKKYGKLIVDEKMDGMYCAAGENYYESRSGQNLYLDHIFNDLTGKINNVFGKEMILIGELLLEGIERKTANGIINSYTSILEKLDDFGIDYSNINFETLDKIQEEIKKTDNKKIKKILKDLRKDIIDFKKKYGVDINDIKNKIYYTIWDVIPKENYEKGYYSKPLIERRQDLEKIFEVLGNNTKIKKINYIIAKSKHDIALFLYKILENGGEGVVVKLEDAEFKTTRSNQMKIKIEITSDLEIIDFLPGKPGSKFENTLGSIIVKSSDGKLVTQVAGIPENIRDEIWNNKEKYLGKILEVKANGLSKSKDKKTYALLHPRFVEVRNDKTEADNLEKVIENFNMLKQVQNLLEVELKIDEEKFEELEKNTIEMQ